MISKFKVSTFVGRPSHVTARLVRVEPNPTKRVHVKT